MVHAQRWLILLLWVSAMTAQAGCEQQEGIAHYKVAKTPASKVPQDAAAQATVEQPTGEPKDRTLGAIVPFGQQGWFFKLVGPKDAVAAKSDEFMAFVKSIHFSSQGKPQWTLPEGWQEQPGSGIRFATLLIPTEGKPLEVSVTALPRTPGDETGYLLSNVNRWRGQMKLPPITKEELAGESTQLELAGATATLVNLLGTATPSTMGGGPFSRGAGNGK
jgi:hypothetical protein